MEAHFIDAWVRGDANTRAILTEVANWVDSELAEDPDRIGRLLAGLEGRVAAVPSVASAARVSVTFQVSHDDRQVRVVRFVFRR